MKNKAGDKSSTKSSNKKSNPKLKIIKRYAYEWMVSLLIISDVISLLQAFGLAVLIRSLTLGGSNEIIITQLIPFLIIFIVAYFAIGLYHPVGLSPVREMRLIFESTIYTYLVLAIIIFLITNSEGVSSVLLILSFVFIMFSVQINRWLIRIIARRFGVWGAPAMIVGDDPEVSEVNTYLLQNIRLGILPVRIIDSKSISEPEVEEYIRSNHITTAILVNMEMANPKQHHIVNYINSLFDISIMVSSSGWINSLHVIPIDLEGRIGLKTRNNLGNVWLHALKRGMDLGMIIIGGLLILPILALIAVLIKLDSSGSILYKQIRIGRNGGTFNIYKFRTMADDAAQKLESILDADPTMKTEWETTQKLKDDPRITRVGKFLRKWSLDELPQLFNILKGEMSLVGPRPCFPEQKYLYSKKIEIYQKVRPGLTGMWQVSGRNQTSFLERIRYDEYYVSNWSPWLDFYILLRTIGVVIFRRGAY